MVDPLSQVPADEILVALSLGKDSLAVLDLCYKKFKRVHAFFMWQVEGLSFQEKQIGYLERRYGLNVHRFPHWNLSQLFRQGVLRDRTRAGTECPRLNFINIANEARRITGVEWIATGEKKRDSLQRRGWLTHHTVWRDKKRVFPLADWSNAAVFNYLKRSRVLLPPEYRRLRGSMGDLKIETLLWLKEEWPDDYQKVRRQFPYVEAAVKRREYKTLQISAV